MRILLAIFLLGFVLFIFRFLQNGGKSDALKVFPEIPVATYAEMPPPLKIAAPRSCKLDPLQQDCPPIKWVHDGFLFEAKAIYDVSAYVPNISHYRFDLLADLAPYDFVLTWGPMSDPGKLRALKLSQDHRFMQYSYDRAPPEPPQVLIHCMANTHLIPRDKNILGQLKRVKENTYVHLIGYLVYITRGGGFVWKSSLTRDDTRGGSCEVLWVEDVVTSEIRNSD